MYDLATFLYLPLKQYGEIGSNLMGLKIYA